MNENNRPNLYWPVYKNLENEVLTLADAIHICDNDTEIIHNCGDSCDNVSSNDENKIIIEQPQMKVYSVRISDLLFRVCTEIESLIKDLYRDEKGIEPKSPGAACTDLDKRWLLSKKIVNIVAPTFYFQKLENKTFAPFNYSNGDENDYYSAYNALKHDRVKNISKASVHILIRAMAALYLLNIYYRNQEFTVKNDKEIWEFDKSFGSSLFSVLIDQTYKVNMQINKLQGQQDITRCLYVAIFDDKQIEKIVEETTQNNRRALKIAQLDLPEIFDETQIEKSEKNIDIFKLGKLVGEIILKREIEKLPNNDKNTVIEYLKNTVFYMEYIKHNSHSVINKDIEIATVLSQASVGYYYKKLMPLASAAGSILFNTTSKLILNKIDEQNASTE